MFAAAQVWLQQKIHVSWMVMWLSAGFLVGVYWARYTIIQFDWLLIFSLVVSIITCLWFRRRWLIFTLFIMGLGLGVARGSFGQIALTQFEKYYGQSVQIKGAVAEDVSYGQSGNLQIRLRDVSIRQEELSGNVWASLRGSHDIKRGDIIVLRGQLSSGFGTIPASMYRAEVLSVQQPVPGDTARQARDAFGGALRKVLSSEDTDFTMAYLVGTKLTVDETLVQQLKIVGLMHAVVASGYHLTVLMSAVRRLLENISKYLTALVSFGLMSGFILITGFTPSMTRAGLVAGLSLIAWYYGRRFSPFVLLIFAAAITVLINPSYVWGDIGWYLSFAAFAGVLILAPLLHHYFWGNKEPSMFREIVVATLSAQLLTLPICIAVFGYVSVFALAANLLVVPLIPLTMLLTFITGIASLLFSAVGSVFAFPLRLILRYMEWVIGWIAELPGSQLEVEITAGAITVMYLLIAGCIFMLMRACPGALRSNSKNKLL